MELQYIFDNKHITTYVDKDNEPWFRAKEVALVLGYLKSDKAIRDHVDEEDKISFELLISPPKTDPHTSSTKTSSYNELRSIYINESGLYSLIMRSKMEEAKMFKRWVTKEVLPSIRKRGEFRLKESFDCERRLLEQRAAEDKAILEKELLEKEQRAAEDRASLEKELLEKEQRAAEDRASLEKELLEKEQRAAEDKAILEKELLEKEQRAAEDKAILEKELKMARLRTLTLKQLNNSYQERLKTQIFYVVTSDAMSRDNEFKIGGVEHAGLLTKRLAMYNTGVSGVHPELVFKFALLLEVANYKQMESRIKELLSSFRSKRNANTENFNIHFRVLKPMLEMVAENYNEEISQLNEFTRAILETHTGEFLEPEAIEYIDPNAIPDLLDVNVMLTRRRFGTDNIVQKTHISELNEQELRSVLQNVLETFTETTIRRAEIERALKDSFVIESNKRWIWETSKNLIESIGKTAKY